jgi:hypothetical protein
MVKLTGLEVLELPMNPDDNDADASTIREYLKTLLSTLWAEGEGFSGKRPLGNSGWDYDLYKPLIQAKAIDGQLDEDNYIQECDDNAGFKLIAAAIEAL